MGFLRFLHKGSQRWLFSKRVKAPVSFDMTLFTLVFALLMIGWIMVASATMDSAERDLGIPSYYIIRHGIFIVLGLIALFTALFVPVDNYYKLGSLWLLLALVLLVMVLIPGIGREVNGSRRWIPLGMINIQVSEVVKVCAVMYFSSYLVKFGHFVKEYFLGILKPVSLLALIAILLLMQPNFGAMVVMFASVFAIMFMAGIRLRWFLLLVVIGGVCCMLLIIQSPYRFERLTNFINPWADVYGAGYQLAHALIAFGRGGWFGLGLGESVQKLAFLPENHTDFILSIIAEELGALGVLSILLIYAGITFKGLKIAFKAYKLDRLFESYISYGIICWVVFQVLVNMGVNVGLLPTKGLTLPFISYGGSNLAIMCFVLGILLRIDFENKIIIDAVKPKFIRK